jgi:hypothetical protein
MKLRGRSKYGNQKTNGSASKREAKRLAELRLLEKAGKIFYLRTQVPFELLPRQTDREGRLLERPVHYVCDFLYYEYDVGKPMAELRSLDGLVVEDSKGFRTDMFILKKKLMLFFHGIRIKEV